MSGFFKYYLRDGDNTIGKKIGDFEPNVVISGVGIAKEQCKIIYNPTNKSATLFPNEEDQKKYRVMVNGEPVDQPL